MNITTLTPPSGEPLSLADAKAFARIGSDYDDTLVQGLISAARGRVEAMTGLALISRSLRLTLTDWPLGVLEYGVLRLPNRPATSLSAVRRTDGDTMNEDITASFQIEAGFTPKLRPAAGTSWIWPRSIHEWIEVDWAAGFGAESDIPDDIKHALKIIVAHEFENRDASDYRAQDRLNDRLKELLLPWMEVRL